MGTQAPLHRDRHPGSACRSRHRNPTASTTRHARHGVEPDRHQAMKTWPAPSRMGTGSCHEQQSGAGWPGVRVQPGVRRRKTLADCPLCHHGRRHDRLMGVQCLPAALLAPLLRVTPTTGRRDARWCVSLFLSLLVSAPGGKRNARGPRRCPPQNTRITRRTGLR